MNPSASDPQPTGGDPGQDDHVEATVALVREWVTRAAAAQSRGERRKGAQLHGVVADEDGVAFAMRFVDRVVRPEDSRVAARQLRSLVRGRDLPGFLGPIDRLLLRTGALLAPFVPRIVMPLARARMRTLVGHLVIDADARGLAARLEARRAEGFRLNVNLLGEAVLGDDEADRRIEEAARLLRQPEVDYVSVKVSAVVAQLNPWDHDRNIDKVVDRLRPLFEIAAATSPPTFVNLDMEEYHDLDLTLAAFRQLLDEPAMHSVDAGIVLQAYLPDSFAALRQLVEWAHTRHDRTVDGESGGRIKIRLVKGANLAMEHVEAAIRGWESTPYATKAETDANYKRCLDWVLTPERTQAVKIGLASHNLFDVAWGHLLGQARGVPDRLEFEMLQGMSPAQARTVLADGSGLLLYMPVVDPADFDVAISYLFRRLEENASDENFIRHLFSLTADAPALEVEAEKFRAAVRDRHAVADTPRRTMDRTAAPARPADPAESAAVIPEPFVNEPDTDPALPANRAWAGEILARSPEAPRVALWADSSDVAEVDRVIATATEAQITWGAFAPDQRRVTLHAIADELSRRRGDLVAAMVHEASKTIGEADAEVSEAIDFARWYGDRAVDLAAVEHARLEPLGVVCVVPPWNFPVAIPAGGVLAALAAGNTVVLKPAPETPRCAEVVAECCRAPLAHLPGRASDAVQFVRTADNEVGRHLIAHPGVGAVILTGAFETAELFRSWRPDLRIFAETSGKNATIITPAADLDLAAADLVESAFGHAGQKCSATSLAICVGEIFTSDRFRRQLSDSVRSLAVGPSADAGTSVAPLIRPPDDKLTRGLTELEPGESWLVEPRRIDERAWSPGVKLGVADGSWFHQTECFGPVLGLMSAPDLETAIEFQNATAFGLTGGIQSLDPGEIDQWVETVEVGNAYVNRTTTGAIVQRQPFGGWKRSSVGPGAKAGGPNYVAQLGHWLPTDALLDDGAWLARAAASDAHWWAREFSVEHDPTALFCESNVFRYRPLPLVAIRVGSHARPREVERVLAAAKVCDVETLFSRADEESASAFLARAEASAVARVRVVGDAEPEVVRGATARGVHTVTAAVTSNGRIELLHFLREQAVSRTRHRYGNLV